nr:YqaE/Pmp3 family membrane protein [Methylobacterium goesingense]
MRPQPRDRNPPGAAVSNLVRIILAIFLPPIAVLLTTGIGLQFLLNILLTLMGVLPGTIHALWLVLRDR